MTIVKIVLVDVAKSLGIKHIIAHDKNMGYGANQKSCYKKAIELNADIVVMLHPDYQYSPKLIPSMCLLITNNVYDVVLGSRILNDNAIKNGMPFYKYISNRTLTFFQNLLMNQKFSEFHTGYRCFKASTLQQVPFYKNSNDFIFDNQIIAQLCMQNVKFGEISCPAKYEKDSSSINFIRSVKYGFGVLKVSFQYFLHRNTIIKFNLFNQ